MQHVRNHERIATIHEDASLREAAERMATQGIGCIVAVDDSGAVTGILTDRDLCRRAAAFDRDPDESTVARAMTHQPCTASIHDSRESHIRTMRSVGVRRLPLLADDGRPVELVSLDDHLISLSRALSRLAQIAQPGRRHGPLRARGIGKRQPEERVNRLFDLRPDERIDESDEIVGADLARAMERLG